MLGGDDLLKDTLVSNAGCVKINDVAQELKIEYGYETYQKDGVLWFVHCMLTATWVTCLTDSIGLLYVCHINR